MSSSETDVASRAVLFGDDACDGSLPQSFRTLSVPHLEQRHYGLAWQDALFVAVVPLSHRREQRSPRLHDAAGVGRSGRGDLVEVVEEARRRGDGRVHGDAGP